MNRRFTQLTPWILAAVSLAALAAASALFGGADAAVFAYVPFFTIWFLAAVAVAQRALALPASRARIASVAAAGALLAAPVAWHAPLTAVLAAFFVAGEIFIAT